MPSLMDMMMAAGDNDDDERPKLAPDIEAIRLRDSYAAYRVKHEFRPGMIVRQKPQALLYRGYGDNDLAIVVEVLAEPIITGLDKEGTPHFREPVDMRVGSIEGGKHFAVYHVDSRRFEPVAEEDAA